MPKSTLVTLAVMLLISPWIANFANASETPAIPKTPPPPNVVVTIRPVHSLAVAIMEGIATPKLLLFSAASAHSYALRPSDGQTLSSATMVVRVSKNLEVFLDRPLQTLADKAVIVSLEDAPGLMLLPIRRSATFSDAHAHDHGGERHSHVHDKGKDSAASDVHFWLHVPNAIKITDYLALKLAEIDPKNSGQYRANAESLKAKLAALHIELHEKLKPLKGKSFIVFHDVMQYFENLYGLSVAGSTTVSPERQPGARRLGQIRNKIKELRAVCVLAEPQFPPKLVATLVDGTSARTGTFDEIGVETPPGRDHYFAFMRKNADDLIACAGL